MGCALTVFDAQAVVALLAGEPAAPLLERLLRNPAEPCVISATNLAESLDVLVRLGEASLRDAEDGLRWLGYGGLRTVPVDERIAFLAGRLRARAYHRSRRPLSLADCTALATAIALGEPLATADAALLTTAREEGCEVVALPDSAGARPIVRPTEG